MNLSVFWRYLCKIKVKENVLHIETETFCVFQYIQQIWYYSEILSGIHTTFKQVLERYSSCACECKLFYGIRMSYEPSFLEKIISLFPFSSIFFNFIINDSIFGVVSIRNDSGIGLCLYCWFWHNYSLSHSWHSYYYFHLYSFTIWNL